MTDKLFGEIMDGFVVFLRDQQAMAGKDRSVVEERQRDLVLEDYCAVGHTSNDAAEGTLVWVTSPSGHRRHRSFLDGKPPLDWV